MGITIIGGRGDDNEWRHQLLEHVLGVNAIGGTTSTDVNDEISRVVLLASRLTDPEKQEFNSLLRAESIRGNPKYLPGAILRAKNPEAFRDIFLEVKKLVASNLAN